MSKKKSRQEILVEETRELLSAAEKVMQGLYARIDAAPSNAVPVFNGIVDLHDAIHRTRAALAKAEARS